MGVFDLTMEMQLGKDYYTNDDLNELMERGYNCDDYWKLDFSYKSPMDRLRDGE